MHCFDVVSYQLLVNKFCWSLPSIRHYIKVGCVEFWDSIYLCLHPLLSCATGVADLFLGHCWMAKRWDCVNVEASDTCTCQGWVWSHVVEGFRGHVALLRLDFLLSEFPNPNVTIWWSLPLSRFASLAHVTGHVYTVMTSYINSPLFRLFHWYLHLYTASLNSTQ